MKSDILRRITCSARAAIGPAACAAGPLVLLAGLLAVLHLDVIAGGRTLLQIHEPCLVAGAPVGYSGAPFTTATTCDPGASFPVDFGFDVYAVEAMRDGAIPFWNPYQGLGQPFFANGLSAMLYPANWLIYLLPRWWWDITYLIDWLLAASFLYLYLRVMNLDRATSLLGAACVIGGGYFQTWAAVREVPAVAAWWPLLLTGIEWNLRDHRWGKRHLPLVLATYATITGGQPEVSFLSIATAAIYAIARLVQERRLAPRAFAGLAVGPLVGVSLAAPMWLNFIHYGVLHAFSAHMASNPIGLRHLCIETFPTYVFPSFFGVPWKHPLGPAGLRSDTPGWFPAAGLFLAAIGSIKPRHRGALVLAVLALAALAKSWGLPVFNWIGALPLLDRICYFRYASFIPAFALAALAAGGAHSLVNCTQRQKGAALFAWMSSVAGVFVIGLFAVRRSLVPAVLSDHESRPVVGLMILGLLWAAMVPAGLCWVAHRCRGAGPQRLVWCAAAGVLLQGAAYQLDGRQPETVLARSAVCLLLFVLTAAITALPAHRLLSRVAPAPLLLCALIALPQLALLPVHEDGRPRRMDPLTPPPYVDVLRRLASDHRYRVYSFASAPHPNFAAPIGISSLNIAEALAPTESAEFFYKYLDMYSSPFWFAGYSQHVSPEAEYWRNRRFFDLIGVRYVTTTAERDPLYAHYGGDGGWIPLDMSPSLTVRFRCPTSRLRSVRIPLNRRDTPAERDRLALTLRTPEGGTLARAEVEALAVKDYEDTEFALPEVTGLLDKEIDMTLEYLPPTASPPIRAFRADGSDGPGFLFKILCGYPPLRLLYRDPVTSVRIYEAPEALPRLFLAPTAVLRASWQEAMDAVATFEDPSTCVAIEEGQEILGDARRGEAHVHSFQVEPNEVRATIQARASGILTLTDTWAQGWRATVDGREVPVLRVDGVFRGVRVDSPGHHSIRFWYRPPWLWHSLGLAGMGVMILAISLWVSRREADGAPDY